MFSILPTSPPESSSLVLKRQQLCYAGERNVLRGDVSYCRETELRLVQAVAKTRRQTLLLAKKLNTVPFYQMML
jgi:hypothetical protein